MDQTNEALDKLCINTIRTLSIDMVQKANSGHPGLPLGAAPMAYILFQRHLRHNPLNPSWLNRDRFVLSAGHGSALLYSMLHLTGYDLTLDDLKSFRQWGSKTPGHPEWKLTPGVEATTGPLGQGAANAVGMAIAERILAGYFNREGYAIVNHYTYTLVSDGDMMEGVASEAASLAGHLKLGKLIFLYDCNNVTLDGPASLSFSTEDVGKRFEGYGWQVLRVDDGDKDINALDIAMSAAKSDHGRPTIIIIKTTIGYGSPAKSGKSSSHGSPLGEDEVINTKRWLGWTEAEPFLIPEDALAHFRKAVKAGQALEYDWDETFERYAAEFPELAWEWHRRMEHILPVGWDSDIPRWSPADKLATREASHKILNAIAPKLKELAGGSADLSVSTLAHIAGEPPLEGPKGVGRNIFFGVREHAMAGIVNGMAYHQGLRPFASTFLIFSDYMRPSMRLAAMNHLPVIYIFSHDSVAVGEDGPTHEPIEQLMSLRAVPGLTVIRPADSNETAEAWRWALTKADGPVAIVTTRQKYSAIDQSRYASADGLHRGAYVISDATKGDASAIIIATGSEVPIALTAQKMLNDEGIAVRVVSMPSFEIFGSQDADYRESVLPSSITKRVSVETGITFGWERWVGASGKSVGIDHYGASAPGEINMEKFGFTAENVRDTVKSVM